MIPQLQSRHCDAAWTRDGWDEHTIHLGGCKLTLVVFADGSHTVRFTPEPGVKLLLDIDKDDDNDIEVTAVEVPL